MLLLLRHASRCRQSTRWLTCAGSPLVHPPTHTQLGKLHDQRRTGVRPARAFRPRPLRPQRRDHLADHPLFGLHVLQPRKVHGLDPDGSDA